MNYFRGLTVAVCLTALAPTLAGPHPNHDDKGAVNWRPTYKGAIEVAQKTGKPIFLEGSILN
jgi:hypothetical protein